MMSKKTLSNLLMFLLFMFINVSQHKLFTLYIQNARKTFGNHSGNVGM